MHAEIVIATRLRDQSSSSSTRMNGIKRASLSLKILPLQKSIIFQHQNDKNIASTKVHYISVQK